MGSLWVNGKTYRLEHLSRGYQIESDFEKLTLEFCNGWLSNQNYFEIPTSGSTGTPKKISFTKEQLQRSAFLTQQALDLQSGFNSLVCIDTKYIGGQMMLARSLATGMNIFAVEPTANPFAHLPKDIKIDFVALVPYQVQAIIESPDAYRFNEIKIVLI
jgi:o-succinylbenzoate---CoA ligase